MSVQHIKSHWTRVREGLLATIHSFSDEELTFRPFEGGWSVAELMLHIAQEEEGEIRYGITQELAKWPPEYDPEDYPTLGTIEGVLADVHQRTVSFLETLENADLDRPIETPWGSNDSLRVMLWHVIEHETHHRGELSLVLGLLGREGLDA